ncbi:Uncharacterised protein [Serratia entomophila]|uniref:Uncharacterized protein n=1 Tax=Serratia entomophila TaxID=42906 RepID=A0ABY5CQE3_9GAMM|nr:hypothetical protein [Serratia entomophila]UIW17269.1 hypothetical protein KHA73_17810 [Serratia entomophila]USU99825.1 hypothetical protein KFQ06_17505 [Serratia entomophila]CAI0828808.1 Uncharacterised protein [Serratia entomophila]CAI0894233.1 Uncharacterised protein [Serratia entomophila]CAI0899158.1 Uncharacterised protein [Serratia entomophila]
MNIDASYIKELSPLLLPMLSSAVAWWFLRWLKGYDSRRNCQFDRVSDAKRLSALARIQALRDRPQSDMTLLHTKALYESIGIRLPVWVAHQLVDYLGRAPLALSDLALNCFLRHTSLTSSKNEVFALDGNRLRRQRFSLMIFLGVSTLAIAYGFCITALPLDESEATASKKFEFVFFFFAYLIMAFFIVAWSVNEWESLRLAKAFWQKWLPHLCQNEADYQARCQHQRDAIAEENTPDVALESVIDLPPAKKPPRGWLMRMLGNKDK